MECIDVGDIVSCRWPAVSKSQRSLRATPPSFMPLHTWLLGRKMFNGQTQSGVGFRVGRCIVVFRV